MTTHYLKPKFITSTANKTPNQWMAFLSSSYARGVFWVLMITVISSINDVLMKTLGSRLHAFEISSYRFLFSFLSVLPILLLKHKNVSAIVASLKTNYPKQHLFRGLIGAIALGLCCYSVNIMPLCENTTIMFTQPLFFLPLAHIFLKETVDRYRWMATLMGFIGILIIMQPGTAAFQPEALIPICAALLFAIISIMAKQMIRNEHPLTLLFYFGLVTTVAFAPFLIQTCPTWGELGLLLFLGIGANLIQVCIFKAFSAADASALTPIFYTEIGLSTLFGFLFFGQIPTLAVIMGAGLIIVSTLMISFVESNREK